MCVCFSPFAIKSALDFFEGMRGASERIGFASCLVGLGSEGNCRFLHRRYKRIAEPKKYLEHLSYVKFIGNPKYAIISDQKALVNE